MRSLLALTAAVVLLGHTGCATVPRNASAAVTAGETPLAMGEVGVSPKTLGAKRREKAVIRWTQSRPAETTLVIMSENGGVVRRLTGNFSAGRQALRWDGRDEAGQPVAAGVYLYRLHSRDSRGQEARYDPSTTTGGEELSVERFTFDRDTGVFEFVLPRAARARLRIGLSPFLHLRTLLDWEPMEAGRHTVTWDGLDASGWIRAKDHPNLHVNLAAYALPDDAIIVTDDRPAPLTQDSVTARPGAYLHARHPRQACRDISLGVELPGAARSPEDLPVLQDHTVVRVGFAQPDHSFMVNQRFEVVFAVDTVFLFEEEEGQAPFNFIWDTTGLAPGEHLLTVNVIGYEDHLGVTTVRVLKRGPS